MRKNHKIIAGGTALLLALALGLAAVGSTSAYFSDTNSGGAITATAGSIYVDVMDPYGQNSETGTPDIDLGTVVPGDTVTSGTLTVQNTGTSTQDVVIQFTDPAALAQLNALGEYGTVAIVVAPAGVDGEGEVAFSSHDLAANPLPSQVVLWDDLQPGESFYLSFTLSISPDATAQSQVESLGLDYSIVATQDRNGA